MAPNQTDLPVWPRTLQPYLFFMRRRPGRFLGFGSSPRVCAAIWNRIQLHRRREGLAEDEEFRQFTPSRLLWTLLFLMLYSSEDVLAGIAGTRKTFRKWVWYGIDVLCELDLVRRVGHVGHVD